MGTIIEAVAVDVPSLTHPRQHALGLAERAANHCLDQVGVSASDLDLLINTGIYREGHLGEPALAAIIQEDLNANRGHPPEEGRRGTFSFDVLNGVCGPTTAFQLSDTLVRAGTVRRALVVAEDSDRDRHDDFPFQPAGGAALLSWSDDRRGFAAHRLDTHPEHADLFRSSVAWQPREHHVPLQPAGHNTLTIERAPEFDAAALDAATDSLQRFLEDHRLTLGTRDCLVVAGLAEADHLWDRLRSTCAIVKAPDAHESLHTTSLLAALVSARHAGELDLDHEVVMVSVGAGITVGLTWYHPGPV